MKNSSDTIGNRTRDLPACNAVPQPTALPRTPVTAVSVCVTEVMLSEYRHKEPRSSMIDMIVLSETR